MGTKNSLFVENVINTNNLLQLLKADVGKCLSSYLEFEEENVLCDLCPDTNGEYVFRCKVKAKNLKFIGFLPEAIDETKN